MESSGVTSTSAMKTTEASMTATAAATKDNGDDFFSSLSSSDSRWEELDADRNVVPTADSDFNFPGSFLDNKSSSPLTTMATSQATTTTTPTATKTLNNNNGDLLSVEDFDADDYNPPSMETNVADLDEAQIDDFNNSSSPYFPSNDSDGSVGVQVGSGDFHPSMPPPSTTAQQHDSSNTAAVSASTSGDAGPTVYGPSLPPSTGSAGNYFDDDNPLAGLIENLDSGDGNSGNCDDRADTKSESAVPGVCGLRNIANTCYMNSGLQCLLATPPVVDYFTECYNIGNKPAATPAAGSSSSSSSSACCSNSDFVPDLSLKFGTLLQDVWRGEFKVIKPSEFKDTLAISHPQFKGSHQHDCQEFLALLLDSMHEELKRHKSGNSKSGSLGGTSMELNAPHSSITDEDRVKKKKLVNPGARAASSVTRAAAAATTVTAATDETESHTSSPKSYDSQSSSSEAEAKAVLTSIRNMPIPSGLKCSPDNGTDLSMDESTMDSSSCGSSQPTSNLVAPDSLLKKTTVVRFCDSSPVMGATATTTAITATAEQHQQQNNNFLLEETASVIKSTNLNINDYIKENKTLNINVNTEKRENMNNEISFDSEKYSKEKYRPEKTIDNLITNKNGNKRFKTTNILKGDSVSQDDEDEGAIEEGEANKVVSTVEVPGVENSFTGIKRIRLESSEKNLQLELERRCCHSSSPDDDDADLEDDDDDDDDVGRLDDMDEDGGAVASEPRCSDDPLKLKETIEADRYWEKYLAINDTVIARNFQGQFKNTVVCSVCGHVSVTFEPFMYLSVPLPDALTRQVELTFVSTSSKVFAMRLNMTQVDNVSNLKQKVREVMKITPDVKLQVMEVFEHHISRTVEDWTSLKYLKEDRSVYVIEVLEVSPPPQQPSPTPQQPSSEADEKEARKFEEIDLLLNVGEYQSCVICMEELPPDQLRQHNACDCLMCKSCMERTVEHHQKEINELLSDGQIRCPGCRQEADPEFEFISLDKIGKSKPKLRMLNLPVLSRFDQSESLDNNKKNVTTFGHPFLITVPNMISGKKLYNLIDRFVSSEEYHLVLVNAQGKKCSRCIFNAHCYGCISLSRESETDVLLQANDTIAISYRDVEDPEALIADANSRIEHESIKENPPIRSRLTLEDCLRAFSEKEVLDENNPWYCPNCQKNQCATKTLTIWRFPDYLIIYLKRFVFLSGTAGALKLETPVSFKLKSLDLTAYLSGPLPEGRPRFDLYACVNHFGSVCGGHYTAFTRKNDEWNYYDDCSVQEKKVPGMSVGDNTAAYILFYNRATGPYCKGSHRGNGTGRTGNLSSRLLTNKFNLESMEIPSSLSRIEDGNDDKKSDEMNF